MIGLGNFSVFQVGNDSMGWHRPVCRFLGFSLDTILSELCVCRRLKLSSGELRDRWAGAGWASRGSNVKAWSSSARKGKGEDGERESERVRERRKRKESAVNTLRIPPACKAPKFKVTGENFTTFLRKFKIFRRGLGFSLFRRLF